MAIINPVDINNDYSPTETFFSKIDFAQDAILDCLCNYRQVQIIGDAGTGKTLIGIKKAVRDALEGN